MHSSAGMAGFGYLTSPRTVGSSCMFTMLKLNVTVYFTPELPFTPPAFTNQPQKVVDVLKIMVVMTPDKSVKHLKLQIGKTISIVSKDENLPFGHNLNLLSVRNSQNYVAHNEMVLGHAFNHDENIYAIVLAESGRPWQYMASPISNRHQSMQNNYHYNRNQDISHQISNNGRNHSHHISERNERVRNIHSNENVSTSEESNDSEDTYESSFVEKEDRGGFLDLEAEESDGMFSFIDYKGTVSSDGSPTPKFKNTTASSSSRKLSLKELKRRRKTAIQVSESEEDTYPQEFKSHSHYMASLIDEKVPSNSEHDQKHLEAQEDKEVDEDVVLKDIENNEPSPDLKHLKKDETGAASPKDIVSSDESSDSSEEPSVQVKLHQVTEIARDSENDSESSSGSGSDTESESSEATTQDATTPNDASKSLETPKIENKSESDESESESDGKSEINSENTIKASRKEKISTKPHKQTSKRKYSSLSEIASNASNHSPSPKADNHNKQNFSSSVTSSESSDSEANNTKGKKVRRSSLRALSKDGIIE